MGISGRRFGVTMRAFTGSDHRQSWEPLRRLLQG